MDKIWLIVKREYMTRVMKKSFLLITLLTPLAIGLISLLGGYFASGAGGSVKKAALIDRAGVTTEKSFTFDNINYTVLSDPIDSLKKNYQDRGYSMLIEIPPFNDLSAVNQQLNYYSQEKLGLKTIESIEDKMEVLFSDYKIKNSSIDKETLDKLKIKIKLENALILDNDSNIKGDKSSKFSTAISSGLSYIMGFLMYMVIFVFGAMVMRSVMEEKINRIVEVMVSTVKPFQLMLGKVIGVGLVGLTQLAIWIILIPIIIMLVGTFYAQSMDVASSPEMAQTAEAIKDGSGSFGMFITELKAMNWWLIIPAFVVFFFGGYFIYSALFAAVGSAIGDDIGDGQQLMFPIMFPVILAFVMLGAVLNDPNGNLAIAASMFPLTSPIIMPARLPFDPPMYQVILSILILIAGVIGTTWLAARIYRVGIFMYGKKVSFKELAKWVTYKD